jgi:hypothetical protein
MIAGRRITPLKVVLIQILPKREDETRLTFVSIVPWGHSHHSFEGAAKGALSFITEIPGDGRDAGIAFTQGARR